MFNIENSIADWRKQMLATGVTSPAPLEELEAHLREDIAHLMSSGKSGAEAFQIAAARVGDPRMVGSEFKKTSSLFPAPMLMGTFIWGVLAVLAMAAIFSRWTGGKWNILLTAHIFSMTMGYVSAFLAGGFGIYGVCRQWRRPTMAGGQQGLNRAIHLFTMVSAALVVTGFVLGMVWSSQNRGALWQNDPREIATLCAVIWLIAVTLTQWRGQISNSGVMRLGMVGNMVVGLAWFGAGELAHGYGIASYWPLDVFLGVNLFFLGMSMASPAKPVEA